MRVDLGFMVALGVLGCGTPRAPEHVVLVCDVSSSARCDAAVVRGAVQRFVSSNPPPRSSFDVLASGCAADDVVRVYSVAVPERWGAGVAVKKRKWREEEERRLSGLTLPPRVRCSGIAAAIWRAGTSLRELTGRRTLVLVSDFRETDKSLSLNFERTVPGASAFVAKLKEAHLIPDLAMVTVEVCGVHSERTPDAPHWSAEKTDRLRTAWSAAFTAMGRPDVSLRERCSWTTSSELALRGATP